MNHTHSLIAEIESAPRLSPGEERLLARRWRAGRRDARNELVARSMWMVACVVRSRRSSHLDQLDLLQEGALGLLHAAEKFDPDRGTPFSVYARWWIRQAIQRAIDDKARVIRLPHHVEERARRAAAAWSALAAAADGRPPSDAQLASALDTSLDAVRDLISMTKGVESLDAMQGASPVESIAELDPRPDEPEVRPAEVMADVVADVTSDVAADVVAVDSDDADMAAVVEWNLGRESVRSLLSALPPRLRRVLELRYGFGDVQPHTLEAIGSRFGLSRERIRQLEAEALRRLRVEAESKEYGLYLEAG